MHDLLERLLCALWRRHCNSDGARYSINGQAWRCGYCGRFLRRGEGRT